MNLPDLTLHDPFVDQYVDQYFAALAEVDRLCPQNRGLADADRYVAGCMEFAASGILTHQEMRSQEDGTLFVPPRPAYVRGDRVRDYFGDDARLLSDIPQEGDYLVNEEYPLCHRCWDPSASSAPLSDAVSVVLVASGRTIGEFAFCAECVTQLRDVYPALVVQADWDRG